MPAGIQSLINGSYRSQHLKRYYFDDEVVDQLAIPDRIYQHVLLQQLKLTFRAIIHPHCYHLLGPTGVKRATTYIQESLKQPQFHYVIRVDIKSFYASIPHYKLIQDIKNTFDDPKVLAMLEDIIRNPIDTPRGYKNPSHGIALRGPLSQLFSAIYLKPLDEAFDAMNVIYARYQDDVLILCQSKRQMNRCRCKMMAVLQERGLRLSRKKSRFGAIERGFHFLGIHYSGTRPSNNIKEAHKSDQILINRGGSKLISSNKDRSGAINITLHPRTLRKAREQVKWMVKDGVSLQRIRNYLHQWALWWARTTGLCGYRTILPWFLEHCWVTPISAIAMEVMQRAHYITLQSGDCLWVE